jgi:hypothetical protein
VVARPAERRLEKAAPSKVTDAPTTSGSKQETCSPDVVSPTAPGSGERAAALAACQESNEDGIWYWSCATTARWIVHDANSHCVLWESLTSGPRSSGCLGECGPDCNGLNIYTYDCGDHDRCGRVHGGSLNPWDSECGDE